MKRWVGFVFILVTVFSFSISKVYADNETPVVSPKIIISEIKLGGPGKVKEYISLYNQSDQTVDLTGWKIEYAKASFDPLSCQAASWLDASVGGSAASTVISGTLLPHTVSLPITRSLTDNSSGSLRIVDQDFQVHDLVGWGSDAPCFNLSPAVIAGSGQSIARYIDCLDYMPIDTDADSNDFGVTSSPSPGLLNNILSPECSEDPGTTGGSGGGESTDNTCSGLILNEILPNPAGIDSGNEFIEIFNPTKNIILLDGCKLEVRSDQFIFDKGSVNPGEYVAFYDSGTNLTLPNSAAKTIYLIDSDNTELDSVKYDNNLGDDVSYARNESSDKWSFTYEATPNQANKIVTIKPCPAGQFRNTETNRCNKIADASSALSPCPVGKVRNPETHRCRNITSLSSQLTPCKPGQYRNPETNRCRKLSSSNLKPCKPGQIRNPDTNRCRKSSAVLASSNKIKDVVTKLDADNSLNWAVAGISFISAAGYAVWEWRNEFIEKLILIKNKFV